MEKFSYVYLQVLPLIFAILFDTPVKRERELLRSIFSQVLTNLTRTNWFRMILACSDTSSIQTSLNNSNKNQIYMKREFAR